jgi:hypothetical protein
MLSAVLLFSEVVKFQSMTQILDESAIALEDIFQL